MNNILVVGGGGFIGKNLSNFLVQNELNVTVVGRIKPNEKYLFDNRLLTREIAIENIANMRQYEFGKVVTHCPHCLHTIGKEYAKFDDGAFETVHHTELLAELLRSGKLKP